MTPFSGLCVGGPWDGKSYADPKSFVQVIEWPRLCLDPAPVECVGMTHTYIFNRDNGTWEYQSRKK